MPVTPNASTDLSGDATGTTASAIMQKILRRLDDNPYVDENVGALNNTDDTTTFQVAADATVKYQVSGQIDWVEDGTFETGLITAIPDTTHITVLRGHRGTTKSAHAGGARFRYMGRYQPFAINETINDILLSLWPELFDVVEVNWTIPTSSSPDFWYVLPADAERVVEMYQYTISTPVDVRTPGAWGGPHWMDPTFLTGSNTKAMQVYGVAINSNDSKLHAIYLRRLALSNLTPEQQAILVYQAGASHILTAIAGESRPERRAALGAISAPMDAHNTWMQQAEILKRKEQERLMEYVPRRNRPKFRGGRHYTEYGYYGFHPVKPY